MRRENKKKTNDAPRKTSLVLTHNKLTLLSSIQSVNSIAKVCFIVCVRRASLLLRFSSSLFNFRRLGHNEETRAINYSQN